jgi:hypothetical protein
MNESRKLELLRRVQSKPDPERLMTPLSLGFSETEIREMAKEGLLVIYNIEEGEDILTIALIGGLTDKGMGLLANSPAPHTNVMVHHSPTSIASKIFRGGGKLLLDLAKAALLVWLGWWLKKHFPDKGCQQAQQLARQMMMDQFGPEDSN